jgi:hypothetical protein
VLQSAWEGAGLQAGGARYRFNVDGGISGAWLHTDASTVAMSLTESGHPKLPRHFKLMGDWRGPNLVLDDQKSMFMNFLAGGNLSDFERMCANLRSAAR